MTILISLALVIFSFIKPHIGSFVLIVYEILSVTFILFMSNSARKKIKTKGISSEDIKTLKTYPLFFVFPLTSKNLSQSLNLIVLLSFILVPWLLINKAWIQAILLVIHYFVVAPLKVTLDPVFYLKDAVEKRGDKSFMDEKEKVDRIIKTIYDAKFNK